MNTGKYFIILFANLLLLNFTIKAQSSIHQSLIPNNLYTHKVIQSGDWSNPEIWENNNVPDLAAIVLIPAGLVVNYDVYQDKHLFALNNQGTLNFKPSNYTKLKLVVDTFFNGRNSFLNIDANKDTDGKVEIVFRAFDIEEKKKGDIDGAAWSAAIKNYFSDGLLVSDIDGRHLFDGPGVYGRYHWDPAQLSLGLLTMGKVRIIGKEKTDFIPVSRSLRKNETSISLKNSPVGWIQGDEIVIAGSELLKQSELLKLKSINGNSIVVDKKLRYDHGGIVASDKYTYVGNLSRNIIFRTEEMNTTINRHTLRGHVMFMHNPDVVVKNAQFKELGRTNKKNILDDFEFTVSNKGTRNSRIVMPKDNNGKIKYVKAKPQDIENQRGRYGLHFHKTLLGGDGLVKAQGNVVWGSPGWGMVHHDSNADFTDNIVYKANGGGMIAESGSEIGIWKNNFVVDVNNSTSFPEVSGGIQDQLRRDIRKYLDDDFRTGDAYGLQSRAVEMVGNVAADCNIAFHYQHDGVNVPVADRVSKKVFTDRFGFDAFPLDEETLVRSEPPLLLFKDNVGFNCKDGFKSQNRSPFGYTRLVSTIDNLDIWNSKRFGIYISGNFGYLIKNSHIHCSNQGRIRVPQGLLIQAHDDNISFSDVSFYNFPIGVEVRNNLERNTTNNNSKAQFLFHDVKFYKSYTDSTLSPQDPYKSFELTGSKNSLKIYDRLPDQDFDFTEKEINERENIFDKSINVNKNDYEIALSGEVRDRAGTHIFGNYSPSWPVPSSFRKYNFDNDEKLSRFLAQTAADTDEYNDPVIDEEGNGYGVITEIIQDRLTAEVYKHYFKFNIKGTAYRPEGVATLKISVITPESNTYFKKEEELTITANVSSSNVSITKVEFYIEDVAVGVTKTEPFIHKMFLDTEGTFALTAKVFTAENIEKTSAPVDIVVTEDGLPPLESTLVLQPIHDTYLQNGVNRNESVLRLESKKRIGYLMYNLSSVNGTIEDLTLQFTVAGDEGYGKLNILMGDSNNWTEANLSTSNKPDSATFLGQIDDDYKLNQIKEINLITDLVDANQPLSLVLEMINGNDFAFATKENRSIAPPRLIVKYKPFDNISTRIKPNEKDKFYNALIMYPNPVKHYLNIKGLQVGSIVRIYNSVGKLVIERQVKKDTDFTIDCKVLSSGIYFVKSQNQSGYHFLKN